MNGNVGGPAVGAVIGHDGCLSLRVLFLDGLDLVLGHIDGAEAEIHLGCHIFHVLDILYDDIADRLGHGNLEFPASLYTLAVSLACTAGACRDGCHFKPGVILQEGNKSLSHHSRAAEDTYA